MVQYQFLVKNIIVLNGQIFSFIQRTNEKLLIDINTSYKNLADLAAITIMTKAISISFKNNEPLTHDSDVEVYAREFLWKSYFIKIHYHYHYPHMAVKPLMIKK